MSELKVRHYEERDLAELVKMFHQQGFQYEFPNLSDPIFAEKLVLTNGDDVPKMALAARITTEQFYLQNPAGGTPQERWEWFKRLHRAMELALWRRGADDTHAFLPPEIAKSFGKRLEHLGWARDTAWPCYSKYLVGPMSSEVSHG